MFLGLIEKGFIVDIRKRTARSIWKGPVLKQALRKEKVQGRVRGKGKGADLERSSRPREAKSQESSKCKNPELGEQKQSLAWGAEV